jgi:hypothetical protein
MGGRDAVESLNQVGISLVAVEEEEFAVAAVGTTETKVGVGSAGDCDGAVAVGV